MVIDFRRNRDRLVVAFALAIALHEVILGFLHAPAPPRDTEKDAVAEQIVFETARPSPTPRPTPKPTPTPRPTPPPTPPPGITPPPHSTPAPVQQVAGRAKGRPAREHGGGAHKAIAKAATGHYANPNAAGAGTGSSTGNGAGNAPGAGGANGANGSGDTGTGNGAVNANTPCGFVDFEPYAAPTYRNGTAYEPMSAKVTFPDGHQESARFPYPWIYPNGEQNDPWSDTNLKKGEFEIPLQTPPPGADVSTYPPLIQYILTHSNSQGLTLLPKCPNGRG
ncbi:MAG: hypothetical protein JOZ86_01450 [Candidatus Eremiobacteraeota bacterium]|nr:hypothetical protein [Candidatus Eremiobacteraeota bacterium]